jgi:hypothetical protein
LPPTTLMTGNTIQVTLDAVDLLAGVNGGLSSFGTLYNALRAEGCDSIERVRALQLNARAGRTGYPSGSTHRQIYVPQDVRFGLQILQPKLDDIADADDADEVALSNHEQCRTR